MEEKLQLKLNSKTNIFKIKQGVNFCGYKINRYSMRIRNRGKKKVVNKLKYVRYMIKQNEMSIREAKRLLVGHVGYMKIADVKGIVQKYF